METNIVYNEDCLETMKRMADNSVDVVMTDIPYNEVSRESGGLRELDKGKADIGEFNLEELVEEMQRVCSGTLIVFCGMMQFSTIDKTLRDKGLSTRAIVWEKSNPSPMNAQHLFVSGVELAIYAKKSGAYYDGEYSNTVFKYKIGESKIHPTQKPILLWEFILRKIAKEGHIVFDPFMGSGTTAIACKSLGLNYIGSELDKDYYEIILKRLSKVQGALF